MGSAEGVKVGAQGVDSGIEGVEQLLLGERNLLGVRHDVDVVRIPFSGSRSKCELAYGVLSSKGTWRVVIGKRRVPRVDRERGLRQRNT